MYIMGIWVIVIILVGVIIALLVYYREKIKDMKVENQRLRRSLIAGGRNFEQFEYKIEDARDEIVHLGELLKSGSLEKNEIENRLRQLGSKLDEILKELSSESQKKT